MRGGHLHTEYQWHAARMDTMEIFIKCSPDPPLDPASDV